jgi:hypothetical protein
VPTLHHIHHQADTGKLVMVLLLLQWRWYTRTTKFRRTHLRKYRVNPRCFNSQHRRTSLPILHSSLRALLVGVASSLMLLASLVIVVVQAILLVHHHRIPGTALVGVGVGIWPEGVWEGRRHSHQARSTHRSLMRIIGGICF